MPFLCHFWHFMEEEEEEEEEENRPDRDDFRLTVLTFCGVIFTSYVIFVYILAIFEVAF